METSEGAQNDTLMDTAPGTDTGPATTTTTVPVPATDTMGSTTSSPSAAPPNTTATTSDAAPAPASQIAAGQAAYQARCASCHGADGKKNAANVILTSAETQSKPDAQLIENIRNQGPHRGLTVSDAEATAVVAYIKALK
ncbi:MAG TPA: cytochrome c [Thermoanaerobaculia bacterium]|nr:cytochrome c [Thermoanaerobaculia bacterium]